MKHIINALHNQPLKKVNGHNYVINPITDHYPETTPELLKDIVNELSHLTDFNRADVILGEEDRGGYIAGLMSFTQDTSLAMTKWYPDAVSDTNGIAFDNAITEGVMYVHGIKPGDKVIIVDDLVDTGGTILSMIDLVDNAGATLLDIICIGAKHEYDGRERIEQKSGIKVKHLVTFTCVGHTSQVIDPC